MNLVFSVKLEKWNQILLEKIVATQFENEDDWKYLLTCRSNLLF